MVVKKVAGIIAKDIRNLSLSTVSATKMIKRSIAETPENRSLREQTIREWLGKAQHNPIKRTTVGQLLRELQVAHPSKLNNNKLEFNSLPLNLQLILIYMAKGEDSVRNNQPILSPEVVSLLQTILSNKSSNSGHLTYKDYFSESTSQVFFNGDIIGNAFDPKYQLGRGLGCCKFDLSEDEKSWMITDRFDFNNINSGKRKSYLPLIAPFSSEVMLALRGQLFTPSGLALATVSASLTMGNPYQVARRFVPYLGEPFDIKLNIPKPIDKEI